MIYKNKKMKKILILSIICSLFVTPINTNAISIKENSNENSKLMFLKEKHEKEVEKRLSKDSNIEWNIQTINADKVEKNTDVDAKVKVALIDSGVDFTSDIDIYERKNFIPGEDEVSVLYEDGSGHGTSIAGIIAAKDNGEGITGINPNVKLYSAKVLDENNYAPINRIVEAINWAIDKKVNIISISFGTTTDSEELKLAIQKAYKAGILIIAAAGNHEIIEYPAAYDEVVAVGSVNSMGKRSKNSPIGEDLELVAPGEQILSTGAFGGVTVHSGTSMAVPHVVGVASVLWEKDLSCTSGFIRKLLDLSSNLYGDNEEYGYGLVDLEYALQLYDEFKEVYKNNNTSNSEIEELKNKGELADNKNKVIVFDDVDYVEGSWLIEKHQQIVVKGNTGFSDSNISLIKRGARANDDYIPHMTLYPQWHGYWQKKDGDIKVYECNYLNCYVYLTKVAINFGNGNYTPPLQETMSFEDYNAMKNEITIDGVCDVNWNDILTGYTINNYNKKLFIYGMAIHTATDAFAHSTYRNINGTWTYIPHDPTNYADDIYTIPNRFLCASELAIHIIDRCWLSKQGDVTDFVLGNYDNSFKVKNISENAKITWPSTHWPYDSYFDSMNLN